MDSFEKLVSLFKEFPGIGPRQAERFAYFLLSQNNEYRKTLSQEIVHIASKMKSCPVCFRFHTGQTETCSLCKDVNRDKHTLLVVAKDVDYKAIEKTKTYTGLYFILGGTIPILDKEPEKRVRLEELKERIEKTKTDLKEIILALSITTEGEYTREFIESQIRPLIIGTSIQISIPGRGMSTGTEIEYSDTETIKNALSHRTLE
jgi:recombination protein RecR